MPNLTKATITFNTHNDDRNPNTVLHVFLKNRSNTSSTPEGQTTYIANFLEYQRYEAMGASGNFEKNPYLGYAQSLSQGTGFSDPSSHQFDIPLRSRPIPFEEIILPVVNVHILPDTQFLPGGTDRWIFDYTVTFFFSTGAPVTLSSNTNGITGIILDQDNKDHSGILSELAPQPPPIKPQTDAVLTQVTMLFATHNDDRNSSTQLNVHIVNRLSASTSQDIVVVTDLLNNQQFPDPSSRLVILPLSSPSIRLADIVLPVVNINIGAGEDRWIFDYEVTYTFSTGQVFSSVTSGIILDQDNHKHAGVYRGSPFPTVTPLGKPTLSNFPINHLKPNPKFIPLSYLQTKLDELVNNRQGVGSQDPPVARIRFHNDGAFGALPQSYIDVQSLTANPPVPETILAPGFVEGVTYISSPSVLGQQEATFGKFGANFGVAGFYFNDVNSNRLTAKIDASSPTPLTIEIDFETNGQELLGTFGGVDFTAFTITLRLTLTFDPNHNRIDLMSWVDDLSKISNDDDRSKASDQFIHVVMTAGTLDPGGSVQKSLRNAIFRQLSTEDRLGSGTKRDSINETFNSWLLGGVIHDGVSPCRIQSAEIMGDNLVISYTGPQLTFQPPIPAAWPSGFDFSPGALANIDHIVVLTMENRSFDHMLGYLSLPTFKGGMGRTDIDGLKGTEFNLLNGVKVPSFALPPGDTIFSPDPPHGFEPVHQAINGGKMDGFVTSCAQEHGPAAGPLIMGYHTAANVPIYDAMARDFAICNRWFASHPGPTFCNRFYEVTGRLNIDPLGFWEVNNSSPLRPVFTPTIFDHLSDQKVSWKYFEQHYCFLRFFEQHTFDSANIATFDDPEFGFEALARSGNLPGVTFIDPHFIELPPTANSNEPPANIADGQLFEQRVVNAVVSSPAWNKTLLIITYDEHGGFFDHVPPPAATPVSPESIGTYGVRVPAFVVSPWVRAGSTFGTDADDVHVGGGGTVGGVATTHADIPVSPPVPIKSPLVSLHFDHTSILKTIAKRFLSANPPYMGARYADAHDVGVIMGSQLTSGQFLPFIPYNFVYGTSKMGLEVKAANADAVLFQDTPNTTPAQQFSFEDAGGGFVYIRTHMGNQYVTSIPAVAGAQAAGIRQEAKYPPGGPATQNPDFQRWKLTSTSATVASANIFTITNAAVPGMVLQPSGNSLVAGIPVLLGVPVVSHLGIGVNPNGWQVTSPLLPNTQNTVKH